MCLIPAPLDLVDLEGIFTGVRMLACVSLLGVNRKAGTKPLCLWSWYTHLGIFSALLYCLSYINYKFEYKKWRLNTYLVLEYYLSIENAINLKLHLGKSVLKMMVTI